jgi:hypothetical protein
MSQMDAAHKSWKGYFQGMPYAPQSSLAFTVAGGHAATSVTPQVGSFENDFYGLTSAGKTTWAAGRSADSDPNVRRPAGRRCR